MQELFDRLDASRRRTEDAMLDRVLMAGACATATHIREHARQILELHDEDTWAFSVESQSIMDDWLVSKRYGEGRARLKMIALVETFGITVDVETGYREANAMLRSLDGAYRSMMSDLAVR